MILNSLFSNHAVLQRGISVPVWGWAKPDAIVLAEFAGFAVRTIANAEGAFLLRLPPLQAGGPFSLSVTSENGSERVVVDDVYIGEVWVASGQSNMEMALSSCFPDPDPRENELIRMITVERAAAGARMRNFGGEWKLAKFANMPAFSGAAYFFAKKLQAELGVPVGIIHSSWGGTRAEAWISRESLMEEPETAAMAAAYEADLADEGRRTDFADVPELPADPGNFAVDRGWAEPGFDDGAWESAALPATFEGVRKPKTNGAFWFRKRIAIPEAWRGRELALNIGAVDKHDAAYFNGARVGGMGAGCDDQFWAVPRRYKVPASANADAEAVVAVRVWSFAFDGGMRGPECEMRLGLAADADASGAAGGDAISLAGEWKFCVEHDIGLTPPPPARLLPGNANAPHTLYDGMIAPLLPCAIRGAIWYQGESNAENPAHYAATMRNLITDWRHSWGQGDFPFIQTQLAGWRDPREIDGASSWAIVREAQLAATRSLPNSGMASAVDIGDTLDIHPKNKRDVGLRLAQWALARVYGKPLVANGPHYESCEIESGKVRVRFSDIGGGLVAKGADCADADSESRSIRLLFIAGANRLFHPAQSRIEGGTLLVWSDEVAAPRSVRYAWADNPEGANLYNKDGFPASPFRTDIW